MCRASAVMTAGQVGAAGLAQQCVQGADLAAFGRDLALGVDGGVEVGGQADQVNAAAVGVAGAFEAFAVDGVGPQQARCRGGRSVGGAAGFALGSPARRCREAVVCFGGGQHGWPVEEGCQAGVEFVAVQGGQDAADGAFAGRPVQAGERVAPDVQVGQDLLGGVVGPLFDRGQAVAAYRYGGACHDRQDRGR